MGMVVPRGGAPVARGGSGLACLVYVSQLGPLTGAGGVRGTREVCLSTGKYNGVQWWREGQTLDAHTIVETPFARCVGDAAGGVPG